MPAGAQSMIVAASASEWCFVRSLTLAAIREITSRSRGVAVEQMIGELRRYVLGWLGYFGISRTYTDVLALDDWVRRRVRLTEVFERLRRWLVKRAG